MDEEGGSGVPERSGGEWGHGRTAGAVQGACGRAGLEPTPPHASSGASCPFPRGNGPRALRTLGSTIKNF